MRGEAENRPIDYGHAADLFLRALKQRPGDPETQFNLALIYEKAIPGRRGHCRLAEFSAWHSP